MFQRRDPYTQFTLGIIQTPLKADLSPATKTVFPGFYMIHLDSNLAFTCRCSKVGAVSGRGVVWTGSVRKDERWRFFFFLPPNSDKDPFDPAGSRRIHAASLQRDPGPVQPRYSHRTFPLAPIYHRRHYYTYKETRKSSPRLFTDT